MTDPNHVDFFVSYNHADADWAEWIAWVLEEAGYTTRIQAWDFRPGSNFVIEMHEAARLADRTIVVLSSNYLGSAFVAPEWAAAFATDPKGNARAVVPVRIEPSHADGLLAQVVWIDLVGRDRSDAKAALLAGLQPGRQKPIAEPPFPSPRSPQASSGEDAAGPWQPASPTATLRWAPLDSDASVAWRSELVRSGRQTTTLLEIHACPQPLLHLEVRRLESLRDRLPTLGRQAGLFRPEQGLESDADVVRALARTQPDRTGDEAGLAVTRSGQRSAWIALPHDQMGAIFDREDLTPRVASLVSTLDTVEISRSDATAFAIGLEPVTLLSTGNLSQLGQRTTSSMPFAMRDVVRVPASDAVASDMVRANASAISEELVARLGMEMTARN